MPCLVLVRFLWFGIPQMPSRTDFSRILTKILPPDRATNPKANAIQFAARDRRTPEAPRRVSSGGWRCIPAPSRRTRQILTRSRRNAPQNTKKSFRNPVWEVPRSLQNRSGALPERARAKKAEKNEKVLPKNKPDFFRGRF